MARGEIEARGLWKKFRRGELHDSLRDLIPAMAKSLFGRRAPREDIGKKEFWAVQDVSFRVSPGESLGIIGHNGAGKSTILKLITKVLRPTRGHCRVTGRIGALIEIAAGFHPDLTGRENLYVQGAIMGMSRAEIPRKFDEIVDFAGIAEFIDTPVKRYSSGMHARLGFSIAAHLDPDVLIIDEILSVGDVAFQAKAFARIRELATSGIPVVVVSHQLTRIKELCTQALVLDHGAVVHAGTPVECIAAYMSPARQGQTEGTPKSPVEIVSLEMASQDVSSGEVIHLTVKGRLLTDGAPDHVEPVAILIRDAEAGQIVALCGTRDANLALSNPGPFSIDVDLQMNVRPGLYAVETYAWDRRTETALSVGPRVNVHVAEGRTFLGFVQLNANMRLSGDGGETSE